MPNVVGRDYLVNKGGLNRRAAQTATPEGDANTILNLNPYQSGAWQVRNGLVKINSTALDGEIRGIFDFQIAGGRALRRIPLVVTSNGTLYRLDEATPVIIKQGLNKSTEYTFTNYLDLAIIANGMDYPLMYDGTTVSFLDQLPRARIVHVHLGRLFMDDPDFPKRVWFTRVGELNSLPDLNFSDDPTGGGQTVKALETYYESLLIFTDNTVQSLSGTHLDFDDDLLNFRRDVLISNRGASGRKVVRNVDNDVYSMDSKGPYVISGRKANPIGYKTERFFKEDVSASKFPDALGVWDEELIQYKLFLKKPSSFENRVWSYNYVDQSVATEEFPTITLTSVGEVENEDDRREVWIGDSDGFVYKNIIGDDDGTAVQCIYGTPWYPAQPTNDRSRRLRYIYVHALALGQIDLTVRIYSDFRADAVKTKTIRLSTKPEWDAVNWDEFNWDGATDIHRRVNVGISCRWIRMEFEVQSKGAFRLNGWGVYWRTKKLRTKEARNQ